MTFLYMLSSLGKAVNVTQVVVQIQVNVVVISPEFLLV